MPVSKEKKLGFGKDLVVACMNMSDTVKVDHLLAIASLQLSWIIITFVGRNL